MEPSERTDEWWEWLSSLSFFPYLLVIDDDYLKDNFNLYECKKKYKNCSVLISIIRGRYEGEMTEDLYYKALEMYGLLHKSFIISGAGLDQMYKKYRNNEFQNCPRVNCNGTCCIPYGVSEVDRTPVMMFCPNCGDVYNPVDPDVFEGIDGTFYGPSWVHMFIKNFDDIVPAEPPTPFVPRIFGFKVSKD